MRMRIVGIIPARLESARIPRKMLADIGGKPLIQLTYEHAKRASILDDLVVATDSREIFDVVRNSGCRAVMTSENCRTGTDRVAEAAREFDCDIVVNIQGDEAFVAPENISLAVKMLEDDPEAVMGTVASHITSDEEYLDRNVVKVVMAHDGRALYFTRAPVPHSKTGKMNPDCHYYKHIGIYSYRRDFLINYPNLKPSILEQTESLEQLRALENGYIIKVALTDKPTLKIDTLEDLEKAREIGC